MAGFVFAQLLLALAELALQNSFVVPVPRQVGDEGLLLGADRSIDLVHQHDVPRHLLGAERFGLETGNLSSEREPLVLQLTEPGGKIRIVDAEQHLVHFDDGALLHEDLADDSALEGLDHLQPRGGDDAPIAARHFVEHGEPGPQRGDRQQGYGSFSILSDGSWTYSLDNADPLVQGLAQGQTVTDAFTVVSFDGSASQTVTVTITGANDAPLVEALLGNFTEGDESFSADLLAGVSDVDQGDVPSVQGVDAAITTTCGRNLTLGTHYTMSGGVFALTVAGLALFDDLAQGTEDSFVLSFEVTDGTDATPNTLSVVVQGANDQPVATDSLVTTNADVAASGTLTGAAGDPDDILTYSLEQGPEVGTVAINADGSFTYTPAAGMAGQDSFSFRVTDGQGSFDTATVVVDIADGETSKDITGTAGNDVLIGSAFSDVLRGGAGNDVLRSGGAPTDFFGFDRLIGGPGDDTLIAEGGRAILAGGPGNDVLTSTDTGGQYDRVRAEYQSSQAGIVANLTAGAIAGLASGEVADGFGTVDQVSNVHFIADSPHDDVFHVDDSYANSLGNFIEVRLSGGNDTVNFDGVGHARIAYQSAGGAVWADLELGEARDLNPGDNFIGFDTFEGKVHVLRGSNFNDELYGSSGDEALRGQGGTGESVRSKLEALESNDTVLARALARTKVVVAQSGFMQMVGPVAALSGQTDEAQIGILGPDPRPFLVSFPNLLQNVPEVERAASSKGLFSIRADPDGVVRRVPAIMTAAGKLKAALAVELLRVAGGSDALLLRTSRNGIESLSFGDITVPTDANGQVWVRYNDHDPKRYISARDVLSGRSEALQGLAGKLVLVGTSATGLLDIKTTPVNPAMPGVEVHAQLVENLLAGNLLHRPGYAVGVDILTTFAVGMLTVYLVPVAGALAVLAVGMALSGVLVAGAFYAFLQHGMLIDASYPLFSSIAVFWTLVFINYFREERQRRQIRSAFGHQPAQRRAACRGVA